MYDFAWSIACPGTRCLLYSTKLHNADVKSVNDINLERWLVTALTRATIYTYAAKPLTSFISRNCVR
jgi:hypothetical protein